MESDEGSGAAASVDNSYTFGSVEDQRQFSIWLETRFATFPCATTHPQVTSKAAKALARWRLALPRKVWSRFWKGDERVLKEINECCPIVERLEEHLKRRPEGAPPIEIVDLCSGFGILSLLLSEILDPATVSAIHLVDRRWPMRGQSRSSDEAQSIEHIEAGIWRIRLYTRKVDITRGREQRQLSEHLFGRATGGVAILAVHLCGRLSCSAVEIYQQNLASVCFLALKPCCLPGKGARRAEMAWTLGTHTFSAEQVYKDAEILCEPCEPSDEPPTTKAAASTGAEGAAESAAERAARRRQKDSGRPSRSAEAVKRRELRRRQKLRERRDEMRSASNSSPNAGQLTSAGFVEGMAASAPLDEQASSRKDRAYASARQEVEQGRRLLHSFSSNLLRGIQSALALASEASPSTLTNRHDVTPHSATLEEHAVQPWHFQNLFLFAESCT